MTAVTTRPLSASTDALLRFVLRLDATLTGVAGVAAAAFANPLSTITGLSPTTEYMLGAAFVFYGLAVYLLAGLPSLRGVGIGVSLANVVCTLATIAVVAMDVSPLTEAGIAIAMATSIYTAFFAYLQYLGVRRLRA
ncbi:MAG: hypothetical protein QOH60_1865 [Mycobacterium sp.]|jgi:hypothetical protein|nr:hypothetical protein [Mycobacterium sp.]